MSQRLTILFLIGLLSSRSLRAAPSPSEAPVAGEPSADAKSGLIHPKDLEYQGAFRLPRSSNDTSSWGYGGWALTYYPGGDPGSPDDGYPGSLFGVGHDWHQQVSEVSIPAPVISAEKNPNELPVARTLQPFADITGGLIRKTPGDKVGGLAYLPKQARQTSDKLYWTIFEYYNAAGRDNDGHGWSELDLSNPQAKGLWHLGPRDGSRFHSMKTTNYLFDIPGKWAQVHAGGKLLAGGRSREAGAFGSSQGPALYAFGPYQHGSPPPPGSKLDAVALLYYPEGGGYFPQYSECDDWDGGAWLTAGANAAVIFTGSKGLGATYYGDGRPQDCSNSKGYHCSPYEGQILFYDPAQFALTAKGKKKPFAIRPYAIMRPSEDLFPRCENDLGAAAFDRERGILYVIQQRADTSADGFPIVHVFRLTQP